MTEGYIIYISDVESTGLNKEENEIIELSMLRLFLDGSREDEQKTWLVRALKPETITEESLKINGHKREDILCMTKFGQENYFHPETVLPQIENWIAEDDMTSSERVLGGQNIKFDFDMMEETWKRFNSIGTFPFQTGHNRLTIDTKELALFIDIIAGKRRKFYNLGSLVKDYGIKKEKAHRADADVRMTKDLLLKQINIFKKVVQESKLDIFPKDE